MTATEKTQSYIQGRIEQYYNWYDSNAVKSKKERITKCATPCCGTPVMPKKLILNVGA